MSEEGLDKAGAIASAERNALDAILVWNLRRLARGRARHSGMDALPTLPAHRLARLVPLRSDPFSLQ